MKEDIDGLTPVTRTQAVQANKLLGGVNNSVATDGGTTERFGIGDLVVDREDDPEHRDPARVMRLPGERADEFDVERIADGTTVADTNLEYPDDDPVVGVCFEKWLKRQDETYDRLASRVWEQARDPESESTPEGFAEQFLDEHRDTLIVYSFPVSRLRGVNE